MESKELVKQNGNGLARQHDNERFVRLQKFDDALNKKPDTAWIKHNKFANNAAYLPIRIVENMLRSVFGVYQVEMIGHPHILGNCVVVSVHLKVLHPILNEWLVYAGTGAVPIELKATKTDKKTGQVIEEGARSPLDFERINPKALHKNIPAALSFAVSNAAKKIGKRFGSDLNNDELSENYHIYGNI